MTFSYHQAVTSQREGISSRLNMARPHAPPSDPMSTRSSIQSISRSCLINFGSEIRRLGVKSPQLRSFGVKSSVQKRRMLGPR